MQRPLWRSLKPGFGLRHHARVSGCLLAALAGIAWGAGRAVAHGPFQHPFAFSGGSRREAAGRSLPPATRPPTLTPGSLPGTTTPFGGTRPLGRAPSPIALAEVYERRIRPMLAKNCYGCGKAKTSGLDLRTRDGMLRGGSRGPALVPGDPEASRLYRYVAGLEKPSMPPADPLAGGEVAALKAWIAAGAPSAGGA